MKFTATKLSNETELLNIMMENTMSGRDTGKIRSSWGNGYGQEKYNVERSYRRVEVLKMVIQEKYSLRWQTRQWYMGSNRIQGYDEWHEGKFRGNEYDYWRYQHESYIKLFFFFMSLHRYLSTNFLKYINK